MPKNYFYINRLVENGFSFPSFEDERHERHVYTHMTGNLLILDANDVKFYNNEEGILDTLLEQAEASWKSFRVLVMALPKAS